MTTHILPVVAASGVFSSLCHIVPCTSNNQESTESSIDFRITKDGKDYGLMISPFNEPIDSASFKKKDNRVDIILKKKDAITWHELRKKT